MDPAEMRYLEEEEGPMMKTIKGSVTGFAAGTIYGTILATWKVPRVERNVALPGLIRMLKMMGTMGSLSQLLEVFTLVLNRWFRVIGERDIFSNTWLTFCTCDHLSIIAILIT